MVKTTYPVRRLKEMARKVDRENNSTPCHSERVADYALDLCRALNIRGRKKDMIITACLIHDVGKVVIGTEIWAKKEKLTYGDWQKIRMHPMISARMAKGAGCETKVTEYIYYQHIWYNGNGYPDNVRKRGQRIPIGARILAICDAYESMTSKRPHKLPMLQDEALEELKRHSIKQFDPRIVETFTTLLTPTPS